MDLSKISVYTKAEHDRRWLDYVRDLKPYDTLILDPDIQQVSDAYAANPQGEITIRVWDWDDGRTDQSAGIWERFEKEPEALARETVQKYDDLITGWEAESKRRNIPFPPRAQISCHLANEPDTNTLMPQIARYTDAACDAAVGRGFKLDCLNIGTGHPALLKDGIPDWSPLVETLKRIAATSNYAVSHEYFNSMGITDASVNPWHVLRQHWAPQIPGLLWKIGEFGLEQLVNNLAKDHQGWIDVITADKYLAAIEYYLKNIRSDIVAVRIFMTDFVDRVWRTFDTRPITKQLVELGRKYLAITSTPSTPVPVGPYVTVTAADGLNIRSGPGAGYGRVGGAPKGANLSVVGRSADGGWYQVRSDFGNGWVTSLYVDPGKAGNPPVVHVDPLPPATSSPSLAIDPVALEAFLLTESAGNAFEDGLLTIRFETHLFDQYFDDPDTFNRYFKYTPGKYDEQYWRSDSSQPWQPVNGDMKTRHAALQFAAKLDRDAAYRATGMGAAQIMGFNAQRVGYPSAEAMFRAFQTDEAQIIGLIEYVITSPALQDAIKARDWWTVAHLYNGTGQEAVYSQRLGDNVKKIEERING